MENFSQKIEDFIDGNLQGQELVDFLKEKELNSDLTHEVEFRSEVNEALQDKGLIELRKLLDDQKRKNTSKDSVFNISREVIKTWHLAAASFALIMVVGGLWYILSNKPYSTDKLVSKYYKPAHPILQVRSVEISSEDALKEAFDHYKLNDYKNALKYFTLIDNQITSKFYSGICYIELEEFDKAIESFEVVIKNKDNLFVEQAEWYLGLIYLMNDQKSNALMQFTKISQSESYYARQAEEILKYLN
jgi:tetratricopeptide (TPR) repeat protein